MSERDASTVDLPDEAGLVASDDIENLPVESVSEGASEEHRARSGKRLTDAEWQIAKRMWQVDGNTLKEIGSHLGISEASLSDRFKRHGMRKNEFSDIKRQAVLDERVRQAQDGAKELVADAFELRRLAIKGMSLITKHGVKIVMDNAKADGGGAFALGYPNIKALNEAAKLMKAARDCSDDLILTFEEKDTGRLPELVIRAMTKDDVENLRREHQQENDYMGDDPISSESINLDDEDFEVEGL